MKAVDVIEKVTYLGHDGLYRHVVLVDGDTKPAWVFYVVGKNDLGPVDSVSLASFVRWAKEKVLPTIKKPIVKKATKKRLVEDFFQQASSEGDQKIPIMIVMRYLNNEPDYSVGWPGSGLRYINGPVLGEVLATAAAAMKNRGWVR